MTSSSVNTAFCLDRGGVPHIEADMACDILRSVNNTNSYFCQSYFDALSLVTPCKVTKRDALTELGLRTYDVKSRGNKNNNNNNNSQAFSFNHMLLPRSPLYPVAGGLPTAEAGPSQDLIQGRVVMTVEKWKEVIAHTIPDFTTPLCELIAIQEVLALPSRKRQSLATRNEKWMKETMIALSTNTTTKCVFPLGTHFHYQKENNNNNTNKQDDASAFVDQEQQAMQQPVVSASAEESSLSTKVGINEALYEQWCSLFAAPSSRSSTSRILSLLCLGSGETPEQRQLFLRDIFAALVAVETKVRSAKPEALANLPPLQLVVGTIADKSMIEEIRDIFFVKDGNTINFNTEIICLSSIVPTSLAERGMALQKNCNNNNETSSSSPLQQIISASLSSPSSSKLATQRRDRDDETTNEIQDNSHVKQNKNNHQVSVSQQGGIFNVINLWDADFKFSKVPLCRAEIVSSDENKNIKNNNGALEQAPSCPCYTCERHTAGYFHHLLDVHEMNAEILLTVHNYTQWFSYLKN